MYQDAAITSGGTERDAEPLSILDTSLSTLARPWPGQRCDHCAAVDGGLDCVLQVFCLIFTPFRGSRRCVPTIAYLRHVVREEVKCERSRRRIHVALGQTDCESLLGPCRPTCVRGEFVQSFFLKHGRMGGTWPRRTNLVHLTFQISSTLQADVSARLLQAAGDVCWQSFEAAERHSNIDRLLLLMRCLLRRSCERYDLTMGES